MRPNKTPIFFMLLVIAALCGMLAWLNRDSTNPAQPPPLPPVHLDPVKLGQAWPTLLKFAAAPPRGSSKAPYTIVEIGDFQCPNCGMAKPLMDVALETSRGKALLYFINFPIPSIHPHAVTAARAGLSAAAQGKFWPMYDLLYAHQDQLIPSEIEFEARDIPGFDTSKLRSAMATNEYDAAITSGEQYCASLGVDSTPTILVRDPSGKVTIYLGTGGGNIQSSTGVYKAPGAVSLAANPPWGNGIGPEAMAMLKQEQQAKDEGDSSD